MNVTLFRDMPTERWFSMDRYADELTQALREQGHSVRAVTVRHPWAGLRGRPNAVANYAWRYGVYPRYARRHQGDVNHILDHSYAHLLRWLDPQRTVVTCHDIAPLVFDPPGKGLSRRLWLSAFETMFRAARLIAGSHFTQAELEAARPDAVRRVTVVGYGVNDAFRQTVAAPTLERLRQLYGAGRPLIVHVGSCQPRKNLEAILKALPDLSELGVTFVQVGGRFTPAQTDLIEALGLRGAVHQVRAPSDEDLRAWYQAADVFVFPSLYEGFGLPVLEAMASGTPVVCAHHGAVAEVAGDAAMLVDPHDPIALSRAMREVLSQPALQRDLSTKGRARSLEFTWAGVARATWQVYERVYDECRHALAGAA